MDLPRTNLLYTKSWEQLKESLLSTKESSSDWTRLNIKIQFWIAFFRRRTSPRVRGSLCEGSEDNFRTRKKINEYQPILWWIPGKPTSFLPQTNSWYCTRTDNFWDWVCGPTIFYGLIVIILNDMSHLINVEQLQFRKSSAVAILLTTLLEMWSTAIWFAKTGFLISFNCLVLSKVASTLAPGLYSNCLMDTIDLSVWLPFHTHFYFKLQATELRVPA